MKITTKTITLAREDGRTPLPNIFLYHQEKCFRIALGWWKWYFAIEFDYYRPKSATPYRYAYNEHVSIRCYLQCWVMELKDIEMVIIFHVSMEDSCEVQLYTDATWCESKFDVAFTGKESRLNYRTREDAMYAIDGYLKHIDGVMDDLINECAIALSEKG